MDKNNDNLLINIEKDNEEKIYIENINQDINGNINQDINENINQDKNENINQNINQNINKNINQDVNNTQHILSLKNIDKKQISDDQNILNEIQETQNRINIKKVVDSWTQDRTDLVKSWIKDLGYYQIIIYFYLFQIKRIENAWAWLIIVLSAIVSTISLIQFDKDENDADLVLTINIIITILTTSITLIASWMKKQNYVSTISECEKYLQNLSTVMAELNGQIKISPEDRIIFKTFLEKYKDKVILFSSSMPLISPYDWKHTIYLLTKYYPELIEDTYPWDENSDFRHLILLTYHKVKYRTLFRRCISGYYCYSSCCKDEEDSIKELRYKFNKKKQLEEEIKELEERTRLNNLKKSIIKNSENHDFEDYDYGNTNNDSKKRLNSFLYTTV